MYIHRSVLLKNSLYFEQSQLEWISGIVFMRGGSASATSTKGCVTLSILKLNSWLLWLLPKFNSDTFFHARYLLWVEILKSFSQSSSVPRIRLEKSMLFCLCENILVSSFDAPVPPSSKARIWNLAIVQPLCWGCAFCLPVKIHPNFQTSLQGFERLPFAWA